MLSTLTGSQMMRAYAHHKQAASCDSLTPQVQKQSHPKYSSFDQAIAHRMPAHGVTSNRRQAGSVRTAQCRSAHRAPAPCRQPRSPRAARAARHHSVCLGTPYLNHTTPASGDQP